MAELQYKCPCCAGQIEFNASVQKMKCPYCDTEFDVETLAGYDAELQSDTQDDMSWDTSSSQTWEPGETEGMRVYRCQSCGGEIVGDESLAATTCPYCDNPIVMMGQFSGDLKPGYVIPFKLDKKAAKEKYMAHISGKKLLPKAFRDTNHIDEIKGIYVPFWLFDTKADAKFRYKTTKVKRWSDSEADYKETSHYLVIRGGSIAFQDVPVDGAEKMDDALMESIEPFDFSEAVPFQTAYLAGYMADRYDVDSSASEARANERVKNSTTEEFRKTVTDYDSVEQEYGSIQLRDGKAQYVLYPVWVLNTTWNGQKYTFAMNGQTGRFVGDLPCDQSAYKALLFKTAAIAAPIAFAVILLIYLFFIR